MEGRGEGEEGAGERKGGAGGEGEGEGFPDYDDGDEFESEDEALDPTIELVALLSRKMDDAERREFDVWRVAGPSVKYLAQIEKEVNHWKAQCERKMRQDCEQETARAVAARETAEQRAADLEELLEEAKQERDAARNQAQAGFGEAVENPALAIAEQQLQKARDRLREREEQAKQEIEEWEAEHRPERLATEIEEAKQAVEACMTTGAEDAEELFTEHADRIRAGRLQEAPPSSPRYVRNLMTNAIRAVAAMREAEQKVQDTGRELKRLRARHEADLDDLRRELDAAERYRDTVRERPEWDTRFLVHHIKKYVEQHMDALASMQRVQLQQPRAMELDRVGLVALHKATDGPNWKVKWDLSAPVELWHGVTTDADSGRLVGLDLRDNRLRGTLPPEVGHWTALRKLCLQNALGTVDEDKNQLTTLPAEVGNWTAMTNLDLRGNQLTTLPAEVGNWTAMTELWLDGNQLTTLPAEVGNWTAMTTLYLQSNQLTTLPAEVGNWTAMTKLWLQSNQLTTLPAEVGNWTAMTRLYLQSNQLTTLPAEVGNWTAMTTLYLQSNELTTLPAEVGNWTAMTTLVLQSNELTTLPAEVGNWTAMTKLDLRGNQLTTLPAEVGNWTAMTELWLGGNQLTALPAEVENLKQSGCGVHT